MDFLATAARYAWVTGSYLLAYAFVLVLAPLASIAVRALLPPERILRWQRLGRLRFGLAGTAGLPSGEDIARRLALLNRGGDRPAVVMFLCAAHLLTIYHFLLLGPLLGKDVLLSHIIASAIFACLSVLLWRVLPGGRIDGHARLRPPAHSEARVDQCDGGSREQSTAASGSGKWRTMAALASDELLAVGPQVLAGLLLGGVVAAWGLSAARVELAGLLGGGLAAQTLSALLGTLLAVASGLAPVASLFVATYLWKTGIAHAGLVSFLLASTVTLKRGGLYRSKLGHGPGTRLWLAMLIAAPLAGLATAILFHLLGLTIHYRLTTEQLL